MSAKEEHDRRKADNEAKKEKKIAESWKSRLKDPITAFTGVLATVAILQLWAIFSTDTATHDLAKAAVGQLAEMKAQRVFTMIQLRANLRREKLATNPVGANGQLIGHGERLYGWDVNPWWTNVGGTDAKNVISWWEIKIFPFTVSPDAKPPSCPRAARPMEPTPVLVQSQGRLIQVNKRLLIEDAQKAMKGDVSQLIYIYGRIEYNDAFPNTPLHYLDWCVNVTPDDISKNIFSFGRLREESD
jgi:hypothetical protein